MEQKVARFTLSPKVAFISILVVKAVGLRNLKSELGGHFFRSYLHKEKIIFWISLSEIQTTRELAHRLWDDFTELSKC